MKALFDTNILVDYLSGHEQARLELQRYKERLISQITWMEVLAGCCGEEEDGLVRRFLAMFRACAVDDQVAEGAVMLRRSTRLRLPDAIILATANRHEALLVTRDSKDFPPESPGIRIPYRL